MSKDEEMKQEHEDECVATLLQNVPDIATMRRETLEKLIRSAFSGGWRMSKLAEQITEGSIQ